MSAHGLCQHIQLNDGPVVLLLEPIPSLLDVDVVPGKDFGRRPRTLGIKLDIDPKIASSRPLAVGVKVFIPGVEPSSATPGLFDERRDASISPRKHAFE